MAEKIVVDGSNVAHLEASPDGSPKVSNIQAVRAALRDRGHDPIVIVDASLRHESPLGSSPATDTRSIGTTFRGSPTVGFLS